LSLKNSGIGPEYTAIEVRMLGFYLRMLGLSTKNAGIEPRMVGLSPKNAWIEPRMLRLSPKYAGIEPKDAGIEPRMLRLNPGCWNRNFFLNTRGSTTYCILYTKLS
jgi:hypothetical protein